MFDDFPAMCFSSFVTRGMAVLVFSLHLDLVHLLHVLALAYVSLGSCFCFYFMEWNLCTLSVDMEENIISANSVFIAKKLYFCRSTRSIT